MLYLIFCFQKRKEEIERKKKRIFSKVAWLCIPESWYVKILQIKILVPYFHIFSVSNFYIKETIPK